MPRNGSGVYSLPAGSTFTPNTLIQSAVVNSINTDIATDMNTPRPIVAGGTGATTAAGARAALGLSTGTFGFLYGLTLANNGADATNGIDIAIGTAATDDPSAPVLMTLGSLLTKKINSNWTLGSGNGGLDTGSVANGTYHIWLIQRSDTNVVDALFSLSATSPTMPGSYDRKRRIGSIVRAGATILAFTQRGDVFKWNTLQLSFSANSLGTAALTITATAPSGIVLQALINVNLLSSAGNTVYISDLTSADQAPSAQIATLGGTATNISSVATVFTSTSATFRARLAVGSATETLNISTVGWVDTRGRI